MKYPYYPGCSLEGTAKEYDISVQSVCQTLGIELEEVEDWTCCGTSPAHETDHLLVAALSVKNLATVSQTDDKVAVPCAACFNRLKIADYEISRNPEFRDEVNNVAEIDYQGGVKVLHMLNVIADDYGLDNLKGKIVKKLDKLKVACYYGCLLVRPAKIMNFDDSENPQIMDRVVEATGAEVLDWSFKVDCCGASFAIPRTDIILKLVNAILGNANAAGADIISVACPLCQANLDMRQDEIAEEYGTAYNIPILYFTQILGIALGLTPKQIGLGKLMVDARPLLSERGIIS